MYLTEVHVCAVEWEVMCRSGRRCGEHFLFLYRRTVARAPSSASWGFQQGMNLENATVRKKWLSWITYRVQKCVLWRTDLMLSRLFCCPSVSSHFSTSGKSSRNRSPKGTWKTWTFRSWLTVSFQTRQMFIFSLQLTASEQGVGCRIPRFWNANRLTIAWAHRASKRKPRVFSQQA